mgnify:CR=1 FL=1
MRIQRNIGADVMMQLDELIQGQSDATSARSAMERSLRWLQRCQVEFDRISREGRAPAPAFEVHPDAPALATHDLARDVIAPAQALFPIVQGGTHPELRRESIAGIMDTGDWSGIAIGGLSVGETKPLTYATIEVCDAALPRSVPRYLMGVGFPDDLIEGVRRGVDLFDCVAPTRLGRDGTAFTPEGKLQIRQSSNRTDRRPVVEGCECPCCEKYDRAYVRHLFASDEMFGKRLLALHNVSFLIRLMQDARTNLLNRTFDAWADEWLARYRGGSAGVVDQPA